MSYCPIKVLGNELPVHVTFLIAIRDAWARRATVYPCVHQLPPPRLTEIPDPVYCPKDDTVVMQVTDTAGGSPWFSLEIGAESVRKGFFETPLGIRRPPKIDKPG